MMSMQKNVLSCLFNCCFFPTMHQWPLGIAVWKKKERKRWRDGGDCWGGAWEGVSFWKKPVDLSVGTLNPQPSSSNRPITRLPLSPYSLHLFKLPMENILPCLPHLPPPRLSVLPAFNLMPRRIETLLPHGPNTGTYIIEEPMQLTGIAKF